MVNKYSNVSAPFSPDLPGHVPTVITVGEAGGVGPIVEQVPGSGLTPPKGTSCLCAGDQPEHFPWSEKYNLHEDCFSWLVTV